MVLIIFPLYTNVKPIMKNIAFNIPGAGGYSISCDISFPEKPANEIVLFAHGFKGFKDWGTHHLVASYFAERGLAFCKFNFSHNGIKDVGSDYFDDLEAFASNTFTKELFDLHQVITYIKSGTDFNAPEKIYLIGHSLGGGISIIQTAEDSRIDKLITWASVDNFRKLWTPEAELYWRKHKVLSFPNSRTNQEMPINVTLLEDLDFYKDRLDVARAAARINKPWLIIHGDQDTTVLADHAQNLKNCNAQATLTLITGADHVFNARHPWTESGLPDALKQVCEICVEFLKR